MIVIASCYDSISLHACLYHHQNFFYFVGISGFNYFLYVFVNRVLLCSLVYSMTLLAISMRALKLYDFLFTYYEFLEVSHEHKPLATALQNK